MHEMTIARSICDVVEREIGTTQGIRAVTKIHLRIGKLSGVVPDALSFCFGFVAEGTSSEGASLEIDEIPVEAKCNRCGVGFSLEEPIFVCPECGSSDLAILTGQELLVESLEVEEMAV